MVVHENENGKAYPFTYNPVSCQQAEQKIGGKGLPGNDFYQFGVG